MAKPGVRPSCAAPSVCITSIAGLTASVHLPSGSKASEILEASEKLLLLRNLPFCPQHNEPLWFFPSLAWFTLSASLHGTLCLCVRDPTSLFNGEVFKGRYYTSPVHLWTPSLPA